MRKRKFETLGDELLDVGTLDLFDALQFDDAQDVDGPEAGSVAGCHVLVEGRHGVGARHFSVFFVHVVGAGARVVADPDAEVLDFHGALFVDLYTFIRNESH